MSEKEHNQQPDQPQNHAKTSLLDRINKRVKNEHKHQRFMYFPDSFKEIVANVVIDFRRLGTKQQLLQKVEDEQERKKYESRYNRMLGETNYLVRKYTLDEIKREIGANLLKNILRKRLEAEGDMPIEEVTKILEFSATLFSSVLHTKAPTDTIQPKEEFL
jgi:hypothetical protein